MGIFGIKKVNPKRCQECNGVGIVSYLETPQAPHGKILVGPDKVKEKVCPVCKGIGVVNVPGFERLSMKQIEALIKDKTVDDLIAEFKGMTPIAVESILRNLRTT
jgi:hypothetical protein